MCIRDRCIYDALFSLPSFYLFMDSKAIINIFNRLYNILSTVADFLSSRVCRFVACNFVSGSTQVTCTFHSWPFVWKKTNFLRVYTFRPHVGTTISVYRSELFRVHTRADVRPHRFKLAASPLCHCNVTGEPIVVAVRMRYEFPPAAVPLVLSLEAWETATRCLLYTSRCV